MATSMWEYDTAMRSTHALNPTNRKRMAQLVEEYDRAINTPGAYRNATREQLDVYHVAAKMAGMLSALQLD